ncbi:Lactose permease [Paramyrothecium foliicola]|nr:Lactose permease [Paramyrothecium foliicola]
MGCLNRTRQTPEERLTENMKLVDAEIAAALPDTDISWWRQPHLVRLKAILLLCFLSAATVGYDGAIMNALQINPNWKDYYRDPTKAKLGAINAMLPTGKIIGFLFVAPFSNRYGYKTSLLLAFAITIVGAAIQAAAVNLGVLIFSRFFRGFGYGVMSQPSLFSLPRWLTRPIVARPRPFVGAIAAAWITFGTLKMFGTWSWRIPTLLQGAGPLFRLLFAYFIPESLRYLIAKGRDDEARAILIRHHANGDENSELVKHEMRQICQAVRTAEESEKRPSFRGMLSHAANGRRLIIATIVVLDGVGITDPTHQSLINGGLQVFNFLATVGCGAMLVDILGRHVLSKWSAVGMTVSYVIRTVLNARFDATGAPGFGYAVIPMLFIFCFHYDIALTPLLYPYPIELFPYEWRNLFDKKPNSNYDVDEDKCKTQYMEK